MSDNTFPIIIQGDPIQIDYSNIEDFSIGSDRRAPNEGDKIRPYYWEETGKPVLTKDMPSEYWIDNMFYSPHLDKPITKEQYDWAMDYVRNTYFPNGGMDDIPIGKLYDEAIKRRDILKLLEYNTPSISQGTNISSEEASENMRFYNLYHNAADLYNRFFGKDAPLSFLGSSDYIDPNTAALHTGDIDKAMSNVGNKVTAAGLAGYTASPYISLLLATDLGLSALGALNLYGMYDGIPRIYNAGVDMYNKGVSLDNVGNMAFGTIEALPGMWNAFANTNRATSAFSRGYTNGLSRRLNAKAVEPSVMDVQYTDMDRVPFRLNDEDLKGFDLSGIDNSLVDVEGWGKYARDYSFTKPNNTVRIYPTGSRDKGYFEAVQDVTKGSEVPNGEYSVHFKTNDGKGHGDPNLIPINDTEKENMFNALLSVIPGGSKISTYGSVSPGGVSGLDKVGNGMDIVGTRTVVNRETGLPMNIPIYYKQPVDDIYLLLSDNTVLSGYNKAKKNNL